MANMYVTEFADAGARVTLGTQPVNADQVVAFTATPGASAAFKPSTSLVRVHVDGIASILFGTAPTATANTNMRMIAGQSEYFLVPAGQSYKVSAVTST